MLKARSILAFVMIAMLSLLAYPVMGEESGLDIRQLMTPEQFHQTGLDKLTDDELALFNGWFTQYTLAVIQYLQTRKHQASLHLTYTGSRSYPQDEAVIIGGYGGNQRFLGVINQDRSDPNSIANGMSEYGNDTSKISILNPGGSYGSLYSNMSAFNPSALSPPRIYVDGVFVAFLSTNPFLYPRVDPNVLMSWVYAGR